MNRKEEVIIICHLEEDFIGYAPQLPELVQKVEKFINSKGCDVINITSAGCLTGTEINGDFEPLADYRSIEWIWGFDAEYYNEEDPNAYKEGVDYIEVSTCHNYAEITEELRELDKNKKYILVGGARDECLEDIKQILEHLGLEVEVKEELTF